MTATAATLPVHAFEKAGLGFAHFRCVGLVSLPSPSLAEHNPSAYSNALAALPRGLHLGSCAYCGTALMHNFIIEDRVGRRFVVGCECVHRTGDAGLIQAVKAERKRVAGEKRAARNASTRAAREASWAAERAARAADFALMHADLIERAKPFMDDGGFISDVIRSAIKGDRVSERAIARVIEIVGEIETRNRLKLASRHFGRTGERIEAAVVVERCMSFSRPAFNAPWVMESVYIVSMRDEAGNAIVSKFGRFYAEKGDRFTIRATIKSHDRYDDEAQTVVQRVTIKKEKVR